MCSVEDKIHTNEKKTWIIYKYISLAYAKNSIVVNERRKTIQNIKIEEQKNRTEQNSPQCGDLLLSAASHHTMQQQ